MIIYFFPFQMEENDAFLDAEVKYQKMKIDWPPESPDNQYHLNK
ncbi:Uncharacterised protein [Escherichia coli]|uniref:Uncharacterized protein n=1 Tax=Escherichia coli TaxID=562 RepID=A0A376TV75_ECOLX|nr:hypothetical protein ECEPECC34262_5498 [Escherichia coli EPEC C342-62]CTT14417.1 Uncharacterised protein [Escherichia coli]CTT66873.1 Uncharacterised protein [Escherichia coli]STI81174.1 Uncharacterised protein [Escherichia coli]STJ25978.1 Uncharacterised protein [Escherichia coli]